MNRFARQVMGLCLLLASLENEITHAGVMKITHSSPNPSRPLAMISQRHLSRQQHGRARSRHSPIVAATANPRFVANVDDSIAEIEFLRDVSRDELADPFALVREDLKSLKRHIKTVIEQHVGSRDKTNEGSTNPLLQEAAKEFFERRERAWRPSVVLLMSRAIPATMEDVEDLNLSQGKQMKLAEIVEMMATAQIIHDDVLEDFEAEENGNVAHRMYSSKLGNKVSLLAGDFLLARSSVLLAKLVTVQVVDIIGRSLENMCRGEIMHAQAQVPDKLNRTYYTEKVSFKTASLIADSCRCVAILWGHDHSSTIAQAAWEYGYNIAQSYQISNDVISFLARLGLEGDNALNDFMDSSFTAPSHESLAQVIGLPCFWIVAETDFRLTELAMRGFKEPGDSQEAVDIIRQANGPALAMEMSQAYAAKALDALRVFPHSEVVDGLKSVCIFVSEHDQKGLQRAEWQALHEK